MSSATLLGLFALFPLIALPLCAAEVTLHGRVVDENGAPVRAAVVSVRAAHASVPPAAGSAVAAPAKSWEAQTDPTGAFTLTLPQPGDYLVSVEREGYYALKDRAVHVETTQEVTLAINTVREVFQSENVNAETSPVDVGQAQNQEHLYRHRSERHALREQPQPAELAAADAGRGRRTPPARCT